MVVFSIKTLSCRLVPINTCSSALVPCPKGRESPGSLHLACREHLESSQPPSKSPFLSPHLSCSVIHRLLTPAGQGCAQIVVQDRVFPAQPCWVQRGEAYCTPPRTHPPSFPCQGHSQGTARVLVPFKEDMFCTLCVACTQCPAFQLVF